MANETPVDFSGAINGLKESVARFGQFQLDLVNNCVKSIASSIEPLVKTSEEAIGNLANALNQVLQSSSASIAPEK